MDLDSEISNFNKVKEIVLNRLVEENLLDSDDMQEFNERCHVIVYKGKWFNKWFDKNVKVDDPKADSNSYYIRMVDLKHKEDDVDRLLRRTTSNYDD